MSDSNQMGDKRRGPRNQVKFQRFNINLPADLVEDIDVMAGLRSLSRSAFIRKTLVHELLWIKLAASADTAVIDDDELEAAYERLRRERGKRLGGQEIKQLRRLQSEGSSRTKTKVALQGRLYLVI